MRPSRGRPTRRVDVAPEIAGLCQRVGAALLDGLIITFVLLAAQFVTGFTVPNPNTPEALLAYLTAMGIVAASVSVATLIYHAWGNAIGAPSASGWWARASSTTAPTSGSASAVASSGR